MGWAANRAKDVLIISEIVGKVLVGDDHTLWGDECDSHVVEVGVLVSCADQWAWCTQCIDGKQVVGGVANEARHQRE